MKIEYVDNNLLDRILNRHRFYPIKEVRLSVRDFDEVLRDARRRYYEAPYRMNFEEEFVNVHEVTFFHMEGIKFVEDRSEEDVDANL